MLGTLLKANQTEGRVSVWRLGDTGSVGCCRRIPKPALSVPVYVIKLSVIHINPTCSAGLELHFRPPSFLTWIDVSPLAVLMTAAEPTLRFRELDVEKAIVLTLKTSLCVAFAMTGIGENDVALFELSVGYVFVHPNDSRFICNDDAGYSIDLLTNRESSDFSPPFFPSVVDRNHFMRCPLPVCAAFKRAGVANEMRKRRARCGF
jgi:hypothetical protein